MMDRHAGFSYAMGFLTMAFIGVLGVLYAAYQVGWSKMVDALLPFARDYSYTIDIPPDILEEMKDKGMIVDNANNPTNAEEHSTFLVLPDEALGYVLRPNVEVVGHMLHPKMRFNFNPPVIYHLLNIELSPNLERFLAERRLVRFTYRTDEHGRRVAQPRVTHSRKLLIIGDSVPFGVGVDDSLTIASQLQSKLGANIEVVNAGVGGYSGEQIVGAAQSLVETDKFEAIVYVASSNDFYSSVDRQSIAPAVIRGLRQATESFEGPVAILLVTCLEYNFSYLFHPPDLTLIDTIRKDVREEARSAGFGFLDWADVLESWRQQRSSPFAGFELYVDHCHLSPGGNSLVSEVLLEFLTDESHSFRMDLSSGTDTY